MNEFSREDENDRVSHNEFQVTHRVCNIYWRKKQKCFQEVMEQMKSPAVHISYRRAQEGRQI